MIRKGQMQDNSITKTPAEQFHSMVIKAILLISDPRSPCLPYRDTTVHAVHARASREVLLYGKAPTVKKSLFLTHPEPVIASHCRQP
jgi:hypothetical protein